MGTCHRAAVLAAIAVAATVAAPASAQLPLVEPGKSRLVFNADEGIYTIAADGSGRTRVNPGTTTDFEPAWSPDGASIAFTRRLDEEEDEDQRSQIWAMAPDGGAARPLSAGPRSNQVDVSPTWSPDGARVAFVRYRFGSESLVSQLVTVAASGGDERVVTQIRSRRLSSFSAPAWSPDGARILLTTNRLGDEAYFRPTLYVVDAATGKRSKLLDDADEGAWSPDGAQIAYTSTADRNGEECGSDQCSYNGEVYVMRADGTERRRLTGNPTADSGPDWSPDGERIAFASGRNFPKGTSHELYSIKPDGSCLTWITNGTAQSGLPDWEPGSGRSSDPGGCGAVGREPLIETDTSGVSAYRNVAAWWLGPRYGELLLGRAETDQFRAYLYYEDCASFEPSACPDPLTLSNTPVCVDERTYGVLGDALPRHLARHEGALVNHSPFALGGEDNDEAYVYAGATIVEVDGRTGSALTPVLDDLRRIGADAPPAEGLPLARLPTKSLRPLLRARAAYRKYGSVKAAVRRVGGTRSQFRHRLLLDRKLRELGPFGRIDCKGRQFG